MKDMASDNVNRLVYLFYNRRGFFHDRSFNSTTFLLVTLSGFGCFLAGFYDIIGVLVACAFIMAVGWFGWMITRDQLADTSAMIYQAMLELDQCQTGLIDIKRLGNFYDVLCLSKFNPILTRDFYLEVKRLVKGGSPVAKIRFIQDLYFYLDRSPRILWLLKYYPAP